MKPIDLFLSKLDADKHHGYWMAKCPSHKDDKPSLMVKEREDGKVMVTCFAGCDCDSICGALGIQSKDLYATEERPKDETWTFMVNGKPEAKKIAAAYDYKDEHGTLLFQVVRSVDKDFNARKPNGRGGWSPSVKGVRRILYRFASVLKGLESKQTIWIAEGEKDVWALEMAGLVATTNPLGALNWLPEYSEVLKGASVVIVADKDKPGEERARKIVESLNGVAKYVKVVEAKTGKDAWDHFAAGHKVKEFVLRADLSPNEVQGLVCLSDVDDATVEWLWYPYVGRGFMTILDSDGGMGKTYLTNAIGAMLTLGRVPFGDKELEPMAILYFANEDDAEVYKARMKQWGADMSNVFINSEPFGLDDGGIDYVLKCITAVKEATGREVVVVMDPLTFYLGYTLKAGKPVNLNMDTDVKPALGKLAALVKELKLAWINVRHVNREGAKNASHSHLGGLGSTGIRNSHKSQLVIMWSEDKKGLRIVKHDKYNYSPKGPAFGFEIRGGGEGDQAEFYFVPPSGVNEDSATMERGGQKEMAIAWLESTLKAKGAMKSVELTAMAKKAGHSKDSIWNAKSELPISAFKDENGEWMWQLIEVDPFE